MLYPENIEIKLGFDKIRAFLRAECLGTLGISYVDKIRFTNDYTLLVRMLKQTEEFKNLLIQNLPFPSTDFIDVRPLFDKIKPEGFWLNEEEFFQIKKSVHTIQRCLEFLTKREHEFPELHQLASEIQVEKELTEQINLILDDNGKVKDRASEALFELRKELQATTAYLRKESERLLKYIKKEGFAEEDIAPTIRNNRTVVPVKSEFKRKIKGFIHDESATGQTVYIEPEILFDINNRLKELELSEKREVIRILTNLTTLLRSKLPSLRKAYTFLGIIDFIRAKAKLAIELNALLPNTIDSSLIDWKSAGHPLLLLQTKTTGKKVIPLTIGLTVQQRILIISGPNAGGKSVSLKTVGLIQYMHQCGLLSPVSENSTIGMFNDIFLDMGDEQSLENDLSTYSAHLKNMKEFLLHTGKNSLVLIDEFGTGTEPQYGGAMAEAILEELNSKGIFGVITTHYGNLKAMADKIPGMVNGAMAYNIDRLEPLYRLEIGKPGSSYAFEIAQKTGLPSTIISKSKIKAGDSQVNFDNQLKELEKDKNRYQELNNTLQQKELELEKTLTEYKLLTEELAQNKKVLLKEAKEKAKELLSEANKKIENTIRAIKENKAEKEITQLLRGELKEFETSLEPKDDFLEAANSTEQEFSNNDLTIQEGDYVKIKDSGAVGQVSCLKDKEAEIMIGALRSTIKLSRLIKISKKEFNKIIGEDFINVNEKKSFSILSKVENFFPILDVRGMRGEEALIEVNRFLDDAIILNASDLKIIHGKGDGILRNLIRNYLQSNNRVKNISDEHADRGGAGATLIVLK